MKKIFLFLSFIFITLSCSSDEVSNNDYYLLPIDSVTLPEKFFVNEPNSIKIRFKRPTSCHLYNDIHIEKNSNTYNFSVLMVKLIEMNCYDTSEENSLEVEYIFEPDHSGIFIFKFWIGGENYLKYEIQAN